jgi:hypothetical protein
MIHAALDIKFDLGGGRIPGEEADNQILISNAVRAGGRHQYLAHARP